MPMRSDLGAEDGRLRREQIDKHLNAMRAAVSEAWVELAGGRLDFTERERLARSLLQVELDISRLEEATHPP